MTDKDELYLKAQKAFISLWDNIDHNKCFEYISGKYKFIWMKIQGTSKELDDLNFETITIEQLREMLKVWFSQWQYAIKLYQKAGDSK